MTGQICRARNLLSRNRVPVRYAFVATASVILLLLLPFHLAFAGSVSVLAPVTDADGRLGLDDVLPGAPAGNAGETWGQLAYNAGARVDRWEFRWDTIEPHNGQYNFTATDTAVQAATQAGLQIEGILIGTPGWAAASGQRPGNGLPKGLSNDYNDPQNLWADYVRATVSQYQDQVHTWEIWNEPDIKYFWSSTPDEYYRLLKVAYLTIKQVDPSATVLMGGMVDPGLTFPTQVLADAAADPSGAANQGYFDAAAWHAYGPARSLYGNLRALRALLASKGYGSVPIWVTEDGFPASNPNGEPRQAAYVLQTVAYAFAAGASKVLMYRASDDTTAKEWGLMAADGTPRMGYVAYQVAAHYLAGTLATTYEPGAQIERFAFYEPGQRLVLLWNRGIQPTHVDITADMPAATLVDWMGNTVPLSAVNGSFGIDLPGASYNTGIDAPGTVVGAPPVLLIEDDPSLSGLAIRQHVAPVSGAGRHLVLFNPSSQYVTANVAPNGSAREHETVQIPGGAVRDIDLDLLAGPGFTGFYSLASSAVLPAQAYSGTGTPAAGGIPGATSWYVPGGSGVTIGNTAGKPVTVTVAAVGQKGVQRSREILSLASGSHTNWSVPGWLRAIPHTLTLRSTGPVAVTGTPASPVASPRATWFSIRPGKTQLSVYNPNSGRAAGLDVRFVGSPTVLGQQFRLASHHSIQFAAHGARAVVVKASLPVVAGTIGLHSSPPLVSKPQRVAALPSAGTVTSFVTYNPASHPAHVTFSAVGATGQLQRTIVIGPGHIATFTARTALQAPRGVLSQSDVPVVVTPAQ